MNHWAHLPDEIWARIFTDMVQEMLWDELPIFAFASGHFHALYTLRQVCKKFHRLFLKSSELYSALLLHNPLDGPAKQQLDKHIQLHSGAITRLDASCGHSCLETALLALQKHHCCLKQVYLQSCSRSAVDLLESFSSLHRCMFFNPTQGVLCLHALRDLPHLTDLVLTDGIYDCVSSAGCLTSLGMWRSTAMCPMCDGGFATALKDLVLHDSGIVGIHDLGLSACSNLQRLNVVWGFVSATDESGIVVEDDFYLTGDIKLPPTLSALTALTSLELKVFGGDAIQMDWLTKTTALKHLSIEYFPPLRLLEKDYAEGID